MRLCEGSSSEEAFQLPMELKRKEITHSDVSPCQLSIEPLQLTSPLG